MEILIGKFEFVLLKNIYVGNVIIIKFHHQFIILKFN